MNTLKEDVETKDVEGNPLKLAVVMPGAKVKQESQKVYNRAFAEAINSGAVFRKNLMMKMEEQGLWDFHKENKYNELVKNLLDNELKLKKGGIKKSEARAIALQMRGDRWALRELVAERTQMDSATVEGQADNARFNYLVSACTVYNDKDKPSFGKPYFKNLEDYLERDTEQASYESANKLAYMMNQLNPDFEANLPENKFLSKFKYVDEQLRLVNEDGHLVDTEGRLINAEGRYVDKDDNFVDVNGNPVNLDGDSLVEELPFLEEDGTPVKSEEVVETVETTEVVSA